MRLSRKFDKVLIFVTLVVLTLVFGCILKNNVIPTFADSEDGEVFTASVDKFVTFYDEGNKLTVKTDARTVGEAISRAGIIINKGDIVEPGLDSAIDIDNFFVT